MGELIEKNYTTLGDQPLLIAIRVVTQALCCFSPMRHQVTSLITKKLSIENLNIQ